MANLDPRSKYHRTIHGLNDGGAVVVDVYEVLEAFDVQCSAIQHAIKKLLCAGLRGKGDAAQDLAEAGISIERAITMQGHRDREASAAAVYGGDAHTRVAHTRVAHTRVAYDSQVGA